MNRIALLLIALGLSVDAAYYLSSVSGTAGGAGTETQPWNSLNSIHRRQFAPGDTIYFERGSHWVGAFEITASGTAQRPIVYAAYGTDPGKPDISNPGSSTLDGNAVRVSADYIEIDGLLIRDCANSSARRVGGIVSLNAQNHHITVKNCETSGCRVGVRMYAHDVLITGNHLHSPGGTIDRWWGPMGIVCCTYNVEICFNRIEGFMAPNSFGYDGGAIEVDDENYPNDKHDWKVHHNITGGNEGFMESIDLGECPSCRYSNFKVYYNFSDDYQWWIDGPYGSNLVLENNTVLRVRPANTEWNQCVSLHTSISNGSVKNNIFVLANGVAAFDRDVPAANNLYHSVDGSQRNPKGRALGAGEVIADPQFVSYAECNVRLRAGSPAIDMGQSLGYAGDIDNTAVPQGSRPDAGAYEYRGSTTAAAPSAGGANRPHPETPMRIASGINAQGRTIVAPAKKWPAGAHVLNRNQPLY